jgi:cell wall-associated NlpC family hydrolase
MVKTGTTGSRRHVRAAIIAGLTVQLMAVAAHAKSTLQSGESLTTYGTLNSPDSRTWLAMQSDGNLVLKTGTGCDSTILFRSGTHGSNVRAVMQADGNFVVYTGSTALWSSRTNSTANKGARLVLQDDQNLVIYRTDNTPVWATKGPSGAGTDGCPTTSPANTLTDGAESIFGGVLEICQRAVRQARSGYARWAIKKALKMLGDAYDDGSCGAGGREGPDSSDCSSFVMRAYRGPIPTIPAWSPTSGAMVAEAYYGANVAGVKFKKVNSQTCSQGVACPGALPGDLLFKSNTSPGGQHVCMKLTDGFTVDNHTCGGIAQVRKSSDCVEYPVAVVPE